MMLFLAIAIAGFVLVAGAFLFGHDHDAGHDGGADHGDASHEGDATISIFSTKVLATLFMGFGASAAIARHYGMGYLQASLTGILCGLLVAALMYWLLNVFLSQQASSLVSTSSAVGRPGTVTVSIGTDSLGEVGIDLDGNYTTCAAQSESGGPIPKGRTVRVVRTLGSALVVRPEL